MAPTVPAIAAVCHTGISAYYEGGADLPLRPNLSRSPLLLAASNEKGQRMAARQHRPAPPYRFSGAVQARPELARASGAKKTGVGQRLL